MVQIDIYVHADRDRLYEVGELMGFTGEVLRLFSFTCCEVKLTVDVDEQTGNSQIIAVDDCKIP